MSQAKIKEAFERGFEFEKNYHGCAQCVVGALYEVFPELSNEDVFRAASALGAGVGGSTKGHCGALSGSVMVLSQLYGRELKKIDDPEGKRFVAYKLGAAMVQHFHNEYGTVICGEIQKKLMGKSFDLLSPEGFCEFVEAGGHDRVCPTVVGKATQWATQLILEIRSGEN